MQLCCAHVWKTTTREEGDVVLDVLDVLDVSTMIGRDRDDGMGGPVDLPAKLLSIELLSLEPRT